MANSTKPRVSFPSLDSLRALCFLSVFFYHGFSTSTPAQRADPIWRFVKIGLFSNGNLGVNFFFVLSGFLITYLLITERSYLNRIDIPRFWLRRILRIWPLYFACVAFGFWVFPQFKSLLGAIPSETANPIYYILFISNFDLLINGLPDASNLGVLWSIAIEEQFYFIWPLILAVTPIRRYWLVFSVIIIQSWVFRALYPSTSSYEIHTLSCISDMAIGAVAASIVSTYRGAQWVSHWPRGLVVGMHILFFVAFFFRAQIFFKLPVLHIFERSIIASLIACLILYQTHNSWNFLKLPTNGPLVALGRISYGLYCLHLIGVLAAIEVLKHLALDTEVWQILILQPILSLALTIVAAVLSYRFLEMPFLRLKKRLSYVVRNKAEIVGNEAGIPHR